jgi:dTDP-4-dehydrorhamnose reductase
MPNQRVVIIGSGGRLGAALTRAYRGKFEINDFNHAQLDLCAPDDLRLKLNERDFDVLINAAAFTNVDLAQKEREQAFLVNAEAPRVLAEICRDKSARLIHFSTDYVFDGEKEEPYREEDPPQPVSVYGESKREGEKSVLQTDDRHLVVRVSWVFGPDRLSYVDQMIERARENENVAAVADKFSTPTYTHDIAEMLLPILAEPPTGILHIANTGQCTWQEYAQHALDCCHKFGVPLKATKVGALKMSDMKNWVARRPVYTVLSTAKYTSVTGNTPRSWRDAVTEYVREYVAR